MVCVKLSGCVRVSVCVSQTGASSRNTLLFAAWRGQHTETPALLLCLLGLWVCAYMCDVFCLLQVPRQ